MSPRGRTLIVTPRFFGYEEDIAAEFRRQGFAVDLVDERPSNRAVMKALFRVRPSLAARSVTRHFEAVAEGGIGGYDLVLVIKGEVVPSWFVERLRAASPHAVFVFYTFDSLDNSAHFLPLLPLFDHVFSFQPEATAVDPRFRLKHLFYAPDFRPLGTANRRYDATFIGTLHSSRYRFAKRLLAGFTRTFTHFYVQAPWYFAIKRLTDARFREVDRADVRFDKLDRARVAEVFRTSLAVLDMQHEHQSGLTMRTFEVLASGAYLVTTNDFIEQTPLIDTGRVIVTASEPSIEDAAALAAQVRSLPVPETAPEGFERYSIAAWVSEFVDLVPGGAR